MSVGSRIFQKRNHRKLTQNQLAEMVGVSFQAVSCWERDEYLPETDKLLAIAKALGVSAGYLLEGDELELPAWQLKDRVFSEEHMYTFVKGVATSSDMAQTLKALPFAREKHEGQYREGPDKVPYINHPLTMACHALAMDIRDDDLLAAILLHDVVEDCGVKLEELPVNDLVKDIVDRVTKAQLPGEDRHTFKLRYHARIMESPAASLLKIIDRCCNLSMMATGFTKKKMVTYIQETEQYIFPVMEKLKDEQPQFSNAVFLIKYQMLCVMETLKRLLGWQR